MPRAYGAVEEGAGGGVGIVFGGGGSDDGDDGCGGSGGAGVEAEVEEVREGKLYDGEGG